MKKNFDPISPPSWNERDIQLKVKLMDLIEFIKIVLIILAVYLVVNIVTDIYFFINDIYSNAVGLHRTYQEETIHTNKI